MRPPSLIGLVLIIVGAVLLITGGTFTKKKNVLQIGDAIKVTADEKQTIPPWVGIAAVAAGILLVGAGARKRA